ncbi:hypothetical protein CSB37_00450 [bacterium DOLZORAL124_38_8]|nr:MAG: hypothetical protein CSB37_00450 [bacterium DOLZORAL124_38_8]
MVKIIGHRGAAGHTAENSLESFQIAIKLGCDKAELDVKLSKDNHVVVFHDDEISRVTNGTGLVHELKLSELKKYRLENGQSIPTLQEVIDIAKGKIDLQIELKAPHTPKPVYEILLKNNLIDNTIITSFDAELLKEIKSINPNLKTGLLFREYSEHIWQLVDKLSVDMIGPKGIIVTKDMIEKAHKRGKIVYAYHVTKPLGTKLIPLGIDEIGTDYPELFH